MIHRGTDMYVPTKEPCVSSKEPYMYVPSKEPYTHSIKEPNASSKEPSLMIHRGTSMYVPTKEPYVSSKEPYMSAPSNESNATPTKSLPIYKRKISRLLKNIGLFCRISSVL